MNPTKYDAFTAMRNFGGSFANCIATAWFLADDGNQHRIECAFPELVARYEEMAKLKLEAAQCTDGN